MFKVNNNVNNVFNVNFEKNFALCSSFSIVNFEQLNAGWV